jgi:hypothetical protein
MTALDKCRFAWKYRRQLWKYRQFIRHRREIAAILVMLAGVGAGIYCKRRGLEWGMR